MDKELIKNNLCTTLISIVGGVMSYRPITSALFSYLSTFLNVIETRFLKDFISRVDERVNRLEERIDQEYIKSDDFNNFLFKTIRLATSDVRKEKLRLFANIIVNSTLVGNANVNDGLKYLFDDTIDKIDEKLFDFLLRMSSRVLEDSVSDTKGWCVDTPDLAILNVDSTTFRFNADYLLSVGVVIRLPKFEIDSETGRMTYHEEYYVTQYGKKFVDYVKEHDE